MHRFRTGGLYRQFLLAFLVIGVIPAVVGTIQYQQARRLASDFVTETNQSILDLGTDLVVRQLRETQRLMVVLEQESSVLALTDHQGPTRGPVLTPVRDALAHLEASRPTGELVSRVWVYYARSDMVLGSDRPYVRLEEMYGTSFSVAGMSYQQFRRYLLEQPGGRGVARPITLAFGPDYDETERVIPYIRSIRHAGSQEIEATIMAMLSEDELAATFADLFAGEGAFFALLQSDRHLLVRPPLAASRIESLTGRGGSSDKRMLIFRSAAEKPVPLEFVAGLPTAVAMRPFVRMGRVVLATLILAVVVHFFLSVVLSRRLAEPVVRAVDRLKERSRAHTDRSEAGSENLNSLLDQLFVHTSDLESRLAEQRQVVGAAYFQMVLEGTLHSRDVPTQVMVADSAFSGSRFRVVLFRVGSEGTPGDDVEMMSRGSLYVRRVLEGREGVRVFPARPDVVGALFYAVESEFDLDTSIEAVSNEILIAVSATTDADAAVAVGEEVAELGRVHRSYEAALSLLDADLRPGGERVLWYDRVVGRERPEMLSQATLLNLARWVRGGNVERIESTFEEIRQTNLERGFVDPHLALVMIHDLWINLVKIAHNAGLEDAPCEGDSLERLAGEALEINSGESPIHLLESVKTRYRAVADALACSGDRRVPELGRLAVTYLESNYADSSITLSSTAERFGVSPEHLSRVFSRTAKVPFQMFLINTRLEKAKALLASGNCEWSTVYTKVGYSNPNTFRRAFQRHEGVTPVQYARNASSRVS
jgi:AraC-like DNA-binding protein